MPIWVEPIRIATRFLYSLAEIPITTDLPIKMTAIEIAEPGGPEGLKPCARAVPIPGDGDVLVKVAAAGVNFPDVMQRRGIYPPPPGASDIYFF